MDNNKVIHGESKESNVEDLMLEELIRRDRIRNIAWNISTAISVSALIISILKRLGLL